MIGTRVEYRGSIEEAWGRYVVAAEVARDGGPRYELANEAGHVVLRDVRPASVTPVPAGPKHVVAAAQLRAQIVQAEFARRFPPGSWLQEIHDYFNRALPGRVADLMRANRPVEAEAALLNAEHFVGCVGDAEFQERMTALTVAGDDQSWTG